MATRELHVNDAYTTVVSNDKKALSLIRPSKTNGPWIAGGAVLRWINNEVVGDSDIDVFCKNEKQFNKLHERIRKYYPFSHMHYTDNAITYKCDEWDIQLIKRKYYNSPQEIISNFDLSVCQLVTDGYKLWYGEHTFADVNNKHLRVVNMKPGVLNRITKYWIYGYEPSDQLLDSLSNMPDDFEIVVDMDKEYANV